MIYVVAYDVEDDSVRARIAALLEGFGLRVQRSVFECDIGEADLQNMKDRIKKILAANTVVSVGNVRMYRVCEECRRSCYGLGQLVEPLGDAGSIIM